MNVKSVLKAALFAAALLVLLSVTVDISVAENATDVPKFVSIKGAGGHTLAIDEDGMVWAWGHNEEGCVGTNQVDDQSDTVVRQPVMVEGLSNVTVIDCFFADSMALRDDGTVWMWGGSSANFKNNSVGLHVPVQVPGLSRIKQIVCGQWCGIALKDDGTVWAWGSNERGYLGSGTKVSGYYYTTPVQVPGIAHIKLITSNGGTMFAVKDDDTVWAWGAASHPALIGWKGFGRSLYTTTPIHVASLPDVISIAANLEELYLVTGSGEVWKMGYGSNESLIPDRVQSLQDISTIRSGYNHTVALGHDGSVYTWGENDHGQIGDGTTTNRLTPYKVSIPHTKAVFTGYSQTFAIDENGDLWGWGRDEIGQLGDEGGLDRTLPVKILFSKSNVSTPVAHDSTPTSASQPLVSMAEDMSAVSSPGFGLNTITLLGCLLITAGLLSGFCRREDR